LKKEKHKASSGGVELEYLDHLMFGNEDFEYGKKSYHYSDISKIKYTATITKHSVNFVPTGKSYEVDCRLIFDDGKILAIKPQKSFFGNRSKERHEAVMKAASIFMKITFNQRIEKYEQALQKRKFVEWGVHQVHQNGDIYRNNNFVLNIKEPTVKSSLGTFEATFSKVSSGLIASIKNAFLSNSETVELTIDKDCFLYVMKQHFGITWINTPVPDKSKTSKELFNEALLILGAKLCKSDGKVSPEEILLFQEYFGIDDSVIPKFREVFYQSVDDNRSVVEIAGSLYEMLANKREALEFILAGLIQIAASDGIIHENEILFVRTVASQFHFSKVELDQLFAIFQNASANSDSRSNKETRYESTGLIFHLRVLGLEGKVDFNKVKEVYRELVRRHHPDMLSAQGVAVDKVRAAEQMLMAINVSFEWLEKFYKAEK
jgi:DnaJ like chaperone protein